MIDKELMDEMRDPVMRHCVSCINFVDNINDEPCRTCLHTDLLGRERLLYRPKQPGGGGDPGGAMDKTSGKEADNLPETIREHNRNGQMTLF